MEEPDNSPVDHRFSLLLIGIASAALGVSIYHCIAAGWCNRQHTIRSPQRPQPFPSGPAETPSSIENPTIQLSPALKYKKCVGLAREDGTCAVCLCEFEEGEELRTLHGCMHSFHVPCIDMWLHSHSNCPICRTEITPSPRTLPCLPDSSSSGSEMQHVFHHGP